VFRLLIFNKRKVIDDFNINEAIGIDDKTRPNDNFPDPFVNACFVAEDKIFINVFHSKNLSMHHFLYNYHEKIIDSLVIKTELPASTRNFPVSSYYDDEKQFVYIFYR
jgi:hypothetical protein